MENCGWSNGAHTRGVTLIELLVTLVIMFILASVALPFTKVSAKRSEELELRRTLRTVRIAIDDFRRDWARDGSTLLGPLCVKNQLACKEETGVTGYPKTLETLLKVELTGGEAQVADQSPIRRYLRKIPLDPMTDSTEWVAADVTDLAEQAAAYAAGYVLVDAPSASYGGRMPEGLCTYNRRRCSSV